MAQRNGGEAADQSSRTSSHSSSAGGGGEGARFHPYRPSKTPSSQGNIDKFLRIILYVGNVPLLTSHVEFFNEFEKYGEIIDAFRCVDEVTGQLKDGCFLRYKAFLSAKRAIKESNGKFTFPSATSPVEVKFAEGEYQRLGYAFVTFGNKEMALAAKTSFDGNYVMPGCDKPLIVEFARLPWYFCGDSKSPKRSDLNFCLKSSTSSFVH